MLLGALTITVICGIGIVIILRSLHLDTHTEANARPGLRFAAGIHFIGIGVLLLRRKPPPPDPNEPAKNPAC